MRILILLFAFVLSGCAGGNSGGANSGADFPTDYKEQILRNKSNLFKDPDSLKDAAVGYPTDALFGWKVCLQVNGKNSYGGYTGRQTHIVQLYRNGSAPILLGAPSIYDNCTGSEPFPELEGGYVPPKVAEPAPATAPKKRR